MMKTRDNYSLRCSGHTYVTLSWNGKFIYCWDNDMYKMEDIVKAVEKRTQMPFGGIKKENPIYEWDGLRSRTGFKKAKDWMVEK